VFVTSFLITLYQTLLLWLIVSFVFCRKRQPWPVLRYLYQYLLGASKQKHEITATFCPSSFLCIFHSVFLRTETAVNYFAVISQRIEEHLRTQQQAVFTIESDVFWIRSFMLTTVIVHWRTLRADNKILFSCNSFAPTCVYDAVLRLINSPIYRHMKN
jgi:hypothetical protein